MAEYETPTERLDRENRESLARQRKGRAYRKAEDAIEGLVDRMGSSSSEQSLEVLADRALERARANLDTSYTPNYNKDDFESSILETAIDEFLSPNATTQSSGSSEAELLLEGFARETLDIVQSDNTPGQRIFLVGTV